MWDCLIEILNRLQNIFGIKTSHSTVVMKVMLVLLLGLTAALPENASGDGSTENTRWVDNYKTLNFVCPDHQSISLIISKHQNSYKDQVWDFGCKKTFSLLEFCYWTDYVNDINEKFDFTCPFGLVISGMNSHYNNKKEDWRWKYYCCGGEIQVAHNCQWSEYINGFDANLRWDVPVNYYLVGTSSYSDNSKGDRRWKYRYCAKTKPR
ncbi:hemagglutinin/amebocyte aggregation factor-like [Ascaphus truei]|uniref:hemagglutinin/amebocyte aggregation factor-like n=1 Tax=Ascaphus truei TaxID=8439 RepID=UPI003F5A039C